MYHKYQERAVELFMTLKTRTAAGARGRQRSGKRVGVTVCCRRAQAAAESLQRAGEVRSRAQLAGNDGDEGPEG